MTESMSRTETAQPEGKAEEGAVCRNASADIAELKACGADNGRLRREKIRLRGALKESERAKKSAEIAALLQKCEAWSRAENLLIYVSYGTEVSTTALIDAALSQGKRVYCPKVEKNSMEFYRIRSRRELLSGFRGILEPAGKSERYREAVRTNAAEDADRTAAGILTGKGRTLLVAPGTAFDRNGHRIGYGGGYYDRYLERFGAEERPCCIGLCFDCQLTEHIEPQKHDIAMDAVLFA